MCYNYIEVVKIKKIKLTQGKFALVDDEDYEKISNYKWHASKRNKTFYAERGVTVAPNERRKIGMHNEIMDSPDGKTIDHINNNGLDNRKENLRFSTQYQQTLNRRNKKNGSSKFKGVYWHKKRKKWIARIKTKEKLKYIGSFDDEKKAGLAYDKEAIINFGEFANLNFPQRVGD